MSEVLVHGLDSLSESTLREVAELDADIHAVIRVGSAKGELIARRITAGGWKPVGEGKYEEQPSPFPNVKVEVEPVLKADEWTLEVADGVS